MLDTRLIQRLEKPHKATVFGADNPFAFGGGMKNGGLSDEAMGLLRGVFSFDYMGAAEFEFGAVPKALDAIAKHAKSFTAWSFTIPLNKVLPDWRDKDAPTPEGSGTIYVIAKPEWAEEIEDRIRQWAAKGYGSRLKEATHLERVLRPPTDDKYPLRVAGWLELDNGFFFFTDEAMWKGTADLFGVRAEVAA